MSANFKSTRIVQKFDDLFGINLFALAFMRIGFAGLVLFDLFHRAGSLKAHYTDSGILPRVALKELEVNSWYWSLHTLGGSWPFQAFLFVIAGIAAFFMLVGYKSRLATFCSWVLLLSLQNRFPLFNHAGDHILRLCLFWLIFLPVGARYSWDKLTAPRSLVTVDRVANLGSFAFLLQVASIYFFSALQKTGVEWVFEGSAVYYALSANSYTTPFGFFLLGMNFPFLQYLSFFVLYLEFWGPCLLFFPFFTRYIRVLILLLLLIMHAGIHSALELGLFHWICAISLIGFIPDQFWKVFAQKPPAFDDEDQLLITKSGARRFQFLFYPTHNIIIVFLVIYVFIWNFSNIRFTPVSVPRKLRSIGYLLHIDQSWAMFAYPPKTDGWFIFAGKLRNQTQVDLLRDSSPVVWEKPKNILNLYPFPRYRWRYYFRKISAEYRSKYREYLADYICRDWPVRNDIDRQFMQLRIIYMEEKTLPGNQKTDPNKRVLWTQTCIISPTYSN